MTNLQIKPLWFDKTKAPDINAIGNAFTDALNTESDKQAQAFATIVTGMDATVDWISVNITPRRWMRIA